jgi:SAP domain
MKAYIENCPVLYNEEATAAVPCSGQLAGCTHQHESLYMQAQMQEALTQRGLDSSGTKPVLVDRLWEAVSTDAKVFSRPSCRQKSTCRLTAHTSTSRSRIPAAHDSAGVQDAPVPGDQTSMAAADSSFTNAAADAAANSEDTNTDADVAAEEDGQEQQAADGAFTSLAELQQLKKVNGWVH